MPVPPASASDPHFVVRDAAGTSTESPTITLGTPDGASRGSVRVGASNWFVVQDPNGEQAQSLSIAYTDWYGRTNLALLERTGDDYVFHGVRQAADGTLTFDPDDCDICWTRNSIEYLGPDGQRLSATIAFDKPDSGQPTYSGDPLQTLAPVSFDARDFRPGGAVGQVHYQWRFQKAGCGLDGSPCEDIQGGIGDLHLAPVYLDPVDGATATYAWPAAGTYHAQLTATDAQGRKAVTELSVPIAPVAPRLTLDPRLRSDGSCEGVAATTTPTIAGSRRASVRRRPAHGQLRTRHGPRRLGRRHPEHPAGRLQRRRPARQSGHAHGGRRGQALPARGPHVRRGGPLHGDRSRRTTSTAPEIPSPLPMTIKGPQKITFDQPADREYGDVFTAAATGTDSGLPVTYTAGPGEVCTADGESGSRITAVGIGTCTVTAHQAGGGEIYLDAAPVARSLEITPAGLDIRADDRSKTYGDPDPELTATLVGLKNGDTADDIGGLVLTGPPGDSDAGTYDIVASGASNPNYEIHYDPGKLQILPAPLTVTPDDRERVYGRPGAGVHRRPRRSRQR